MNKKILTKFIILILITVTSCTKESNINSNEVKTIQKNKLESRATASSQNIVASSQNTDSLKTVDSLIAVADTSLGIHAPSTSSPWKGISTSSGGLSPQSVTPLMPSGCYNGSYVATGISSGGMFSSFTLTFDNFGSVSNFGLLMNGVGIGWDWLTGNTSYTGSFTGTTYGTATYNYGIFNVNINYALDWQVSPSSCTVYYSWRRL